MADWDKLKKEYYDLVNNMSDKDWNKWYNNRHKVNKQLEEEYQIKFIDHISLLKQNPTNIMNNQEEISNYFNNLFNQWRLGRSRSQMTLIQLIDKLVTIKNVNPDIKVQNFDLHSYRGYYADLALEVDNETLTINDAIKELKDAIDREFTGYKGGEFLMDSNTPLHIANYGSTGEALIDVEVVDNVVKFISKPNEE